MGKKDRGGYRKDGKKRIPLTLSVTPESIDAAKKIDPSVSRAFEKAFTEQPKPQ